MQKQGNYILARLNVKNIGLSELSDNDLLNNITWLYNGILAYAEPIKEKNCDLWEFAVALKSYCQEIDKRFTDIRCNLDKYEPDIVKKEMGLIRWNYKLTVVK